MVGQELNALLLSQFSIKIENARKIVQRAAQNGFLATSAPLTFGKGQYVYLVNGLPFTKAIAASICKKYRPPVYRLIEALDMNNGIISYYEALKITASPEEDTSSKINTLPEILTLLSKLNFTYEYTDERLVKYIISKREGSELGGIIQDKLAEDHYFKMVRDCMFIPDIIRWLQVSNIIDNVYVRYRNKNKPSKGAEHNGHVFDAFAYTKTTGINTIVGKKAGIKEKQTCVLMDIVINRDYDLVDVDGFYNRVQIYLRSVKSGVRKAMPIVIYKCISKHAFNTLRSLGFMAFDLGSIFGSRVYEIMDKLNTIDDFQNLEKEEIEDAIESALSIMRESGQEDNLKAIKGALFEYLMYPILNVIFPKAQVYQGKQYKEKVNGMDEGYEYDYIIKSSQPNEIVVVELKGYAANRHVNLGSTDKRDRGSLKWFFERSLPFAKKQLAKEIGDGIPFKAAFITSGNFYDDGEAYLAILNSSSLKSRLINVSYDGTELLQLLKRYDETKTMETIKKFYTDIPEIDVELNKT